MRRSTVALVSFVAVWLVASVAASAQYHFFQAPPLIIEYPPRYEVRTYSVPIVLPAYYAQPQPGMYSYPRTVYSPRTVRTLMWPPERNYTLTVWQKETVYECHRTPVYGPNVPYIYTTDCRFAQ